MQLDLACSAAQRLHKTFKQKGLTTQILWHLLDRDQSLYHMKNTYQEQPAHKHIPPWHGTPAMVVYASKRSLDAQNRAKWLKILKLHQNQTTCSADQILPEQAMGHSYKQPRKARDLRFRLIYSFPMQICCLIAQAVLADVGSQCTKAMHA